MSYFENVSNYGVDRKTIIEFVNRGITLESGIVEGSMELDERLCSDSLNFGETNSNRFEVEVYDINGVENDEIIVTQVISYRDESITKPIFRGFVDSCKPTTFQSNVYHIIAYDFWQSLQSKSATDFVNFLYLTLVTNWNSTSFGRDGVTVQMLRNELINYYGIPYKDTGVSLPNDELIIIPSKRYYASFPYYDLESTKNLLNNISGLTIGELMYYLNAINGCFGNVNREGKYELIVLQKTLTDLTESEPHYDYHLLPSEIDLSNTDIDIVQYPYIDCVQCKLGYRSEIESEQMIRYELLDEGQLNPANVYTIADNPLLDTTVPSNYLNFIGTPNWKYKETEILLPNMMDNITKRQYFSGNIELVISDLDIPLGASIRVQIKNNEFGYIIYNLSNNISGSQLLNQTIQSVNNLNNVASVEISNVSPQSSYTAGGGSQQQQLKNIVQDLEANYLKTNNLSAEVAKIDTLTVNDLFVKNIFSDDILEDTDIQDIVQKNILNQKGANIVANNFVDGTISGAKIKNASITFEKVNTSFITDLTVSQAFVEKLNASVANLDQATVQNLLVTSGWFENAVVSEGYAFKFVGDVIKANTMALEELVFVDDIGNPTKNLVYKINELADGLDTEHYTTEQLSEKLNGKDIIANSITAEQIDVNNLFAQNVSASNLTITGNSKINGGKIGGFDIDNVSIHKDTSNISDIYTKGIYLGTDGILNVSSDGLYSKISNGEIRLERTDEETAKRYQKSFTTLKGNEITIEQTSGASWEISPYKDHRFKNRLTGSSIQISKYYDDTKSFRSILNIGNAEVTQTGEKNLIQSLGSLEIESIDGSVYINNNTIIDGSIKAKGTFSHNRNTSSVVGDDSVAMGASCTASGIRSIALGSVASATGNWSLAMGAYPEATAQWSVAIGAECKANAQWSTVFGRDTVAIGTNQTVIGKFNKEIDDKALIVGNGELGNKSNALELDWGGNLKTTGDITATVGGKEVSVGDIKNDLSTLQPFVLTEYFNAGKSVTIDYPYKYGYSKSYLITIASYYNGVTSYAGILFVGVEGVNQDRLIDIHNIYCQIDITQSRSITFTYLYESGQPCTISIKPLC